MNDVVPKPIGPERREITLRGTIRVYGKGWLVGDRVTVPVDGKQRAGIVVCADAECSEVRLHNWDFVEAAELRLWRLALLVLLEWRARRCSADQRISAFSASVISR